MKNKELNYLTEIKKLLIETNNYLPIPFKSSTDVVNSIYLQSAIESLSSLELLIKLKHLKSIFILSRQILESMINIGYTISTGEETAFKAISHSVAKTLWDFNREVKIGELKFKMILSGFEAEKLDDKHKEILQQFTTKKGHEVRSWTEDSIEKRIEKIFEWNSNEKLNSTFLLGYSFIYRYSSEIIHSSVFGHMYLNGMTDIRDKWPKDENELIKFQLHRMDIIIKSIILTTTFIIDILCKYYNLTDILKKNKQLLTEYNKSKKKV